MRRRPIAPPVFRFVGGLTISPSDPCRRHGSSTEARQRGRGRRGPRARLARCRRSGTVAILALLGATLASALGEPEARAAAVKFGEALIRSDAPALRAILPVNGKVQLRLDKLGPEQGYFSAGQVEALFHDFLSQGSVGTFEVLSLECEQTVALVHGGAVLTDRRGQPARVKVHLSFRAENDRWVLREIRELSP